MKRILAILSTILIIVIICIFIFIPKQLEVSGVIGVKSSYIAINRILPDKKRWEKWWPGDRMDDDAFNYNSVTFKIGNQFLDGQEIAIESNNKKINSRLTAIKLDIDSSLLNWRCNINSGFNPVSRISNYLFAKKIKTNFDSLLLKMKPFLQDQKNIYGISVLQTSTTDTVLICTKNLYPSYPHTDEANILIDKLKNYIRKQNALQTGNPMMNISKIDGRFQMMVAIPTNKQLENSESFFFRRMVPGHFLTAEVTGGENTVNAMMKQMTLYMQDYQKTSMAIPFQVFVTDRKIENDTTKWLTKIYFPTY